MIHQCEPILPFEINRDIKEGHSPLGKLLKHPGIYIETISMIFIVCIGIYCLKRIWCRPATLRYWPYSPVPSLHAIVDDDVEAAPIYRSTGMVEKPARPHENHNLYIGLGAMRPDSHCEQPVLSKAFPSGGSLATKMKIQGMQLEWITDCKT